MFDLLMRTKKGCKSGSVRERRNMQHIMNRVNTWVNRGGEERRREWVRGGESERRREWVRVRGAESDWRRGWVRVRVEVLYKGDLKSENQRGGLAENKET